MKLSVVIPAHNEEGSITETVTSLFQTLVAESIDHEILVINDNSKDSTLAILEQLQSSIPTLVFYSNQGPNGFGYAIRYGLERFTGDCVAIFMADLSDSPEDLVKFYRKMIEGNYDCVFGSRWVRGATVIDYPQPKKFLNRLVNNLVSWSFGLRYNDLTNAFKLYKRETIMGLKPFLSPHFNLTLELSLKSIVRNYSYAWMPNSWRNRKSGESKLKIREMGSRYFFIYLYCLIEKFFSRGDFMKSQKLYPKPVTTSKTGLPRSILLIILLFFAFYMMWLHRAYTDVAWMDQIGLMAGNINHMYSNSLTIQDFYFRPPFLECISLIEAFLNCRFFHYNTYIETGLSGLLLALITFYFVRSELELFSGRAKYVFAFLSSLIVFGLHKWENILWSTGWGATLAVFLGFICINITHRYYLNRLRSTFINTWFGPLFILLTVSANLEFTAYFIPFQASILLLLLINYKVFRDKIDLKKWKLCLFLNICMLVFALAINYAAQSYSQRHGYEGYEKAMISQSLGGGNMQKMLNRPLFTLKFYLLANTGNLLNYDSYSSSSRIKTLMPFAGLLILLLYLYCLYKFIKLKKHDYIFSINLMLYTLALYATITIGRQGFDDVFYGTASRYSGASFSGMLGLCSFFLLLYLSASQPADRRRLRYLAPVILVFICYLIVDKDQWRIAPYRKENYLGLVRDMKANTNLAELQSDPRLGQIARKVMIENQLNVFRPRTRLENFMVNSSLYRVTASGLYDPETSSNRSFRWTNGNADLYLPNLYTRKDSVVIRLSDYMPYPDTPVVVLNDNLYPASCNKVEGGHTYKFFIHDQKVIYRARILSKSCIPSSDPRTLGIIFNSMTFNEQEIK